MPFIFSFLCRYFVCLSVCLSLLHIILLCECTLVYLISLLEMGGYISYLQYFIITNNAAIYNILYMYFQIIGGITSQKISTSDTAEFKGKLMCSFVGYYKIPLHECCTHFHSHQEYFTVPICPQLYKQCVFIFKMFCQPNM